MRYSASKSGVTLKRLGFVQGHWRWHNLIDRLRVPISVPQLLWSCIVCEILRVTGQKSRNFYTPPHLYLAPPYRVTQSDFQRVGRVEDWSFWKLDTCIGILWLLYHVNCWSEVLYTMSTWKIVIILVVWCFGFESWCLVNIIGLRYRWVASASTEACSETGLCHGLVVSLDLKASDEFVNWKCYSQPFNEMFIFSGKPVAVTALLLTSS